MSETCFACGGSFGPEPLETTHDYMLSTAACWAAYGRVLYREYSDPALFGHVQRLTVDAYALQHPGDPDERRAVQSFWIHAASLWLVLHMGQSHRRATQTLRALADEDFVERPTTHEVFAVTHADLLAARPEAHRKLAQQWAEAALAGWSDAHPQFHALANQAMR